MNNSFKNIIIVSSLVLIVVLFASFFVLFIYTSPNFFRAAVYYNVAVSPNPTCQDCPQGTNPMTDLDGKTYACCGKGFVFPPTKTNDAGGKPIASECCEYGTQGYVSQTYEDFFKRYVSRGACCPYAGVKSQVITGQDGSDTCCDSFSGNEFCGPEGAQACCPTKYSDCYTATSKQINPENSLPFASGACCPKNDGQSEVCGKGNNQTCCNGGETCINGQCNCPLDSGGNSQLITQYDGSKFCCPQYGADAKHVVGAIGNQTCCDSNESGYFHNITFEGANKVGLISKVVPDCCPMVNGKSNVCGSGDNQTCCTDGETCNQVTGECVPKPKTCCLCLYKADPDCATLSHNKCGTYMPGGGYTNCIWDNQDDKCVSFMYGECLDWKKNVAGQCDVDPSIQTYSDELEIGNIANTYKTQNYCTNLNLAVHQHGTEEDCPLVARTVKKCICSGTDCKVDWFSCSVGQNVSNVQTMAEIIQKAVCDDEKNTGHKNTSVKVILRQAVSNPDCQTPVSITVTCKNITPSYFDCKKLPSLCLKLGQKVTCSNFSDKGNYINNSTYKCCPDGLFSKNYTFQLPSIFGLCLNI